MGQFDSVAKALKGVLRAVESRVPFFYTLTEVKEYSLLR